MPDIHVGNFKGPKGDKGDKGDTGAQGAKGDTGERGLQGPQGTSGATGAQGPKGDTGARGETGLQGPKGDQGSQGVQGLQGAKGDTGARGAQGIQGTKGDIGAQGPKGDAGAMGAQGPAGNINTSVATFSEATSRVNINSGDTGTTIFGKIRKWLTDLKTVAFTGSYNDLSSKPTLGTAAACTVVNNATTTVTNTVMDGRMGKILQDELDELNRNKANSEKIPYADLNNLSTSGLYTFSGEDTGICIHTNWDSNYAMQILNYYDNPHLYYRVKTNNVWGTLQAITHTAS